LTDSISPDSIQEILKAHNISFDAVEMEYGRQFCFSDGAILNVFRSGKSTWQGKKTSTVERVQNLLTQDPPVVALPKGTAAPSEIKHLSNNKVFIVYGHDVGCREQLELLL
jgi:predicted nucleotide-binding protein